MSDKKFSALTVAAAFAGAVSLAATMSASTAIAADKEKCYGVSKVGESDCAGAGHSCQGSNTEAYNGQDFKLVDAGTCEAMNGKTKPFDGTNPNPPQDS